ncbi:MAG: amino acid transport protein [Acidiferrobacter sp.]
MNLLLGLIFGTIGSAYFVYGRKQRNGVALFSGVGLVVFTMLVSQAVWLTLGSLVFMVLPFLVSV